MTVTTETVRIVLSGEFDLSTKDFLAGQLARVRQARPRRLIFDAAQVTYIDCASARLIVGTDRWLPAGVKPVIACPSPLVARVLQASGFSVRCEFEFPAYPASSSPPCQSA